MNTRRTSIELIEKASSEKWMRTLAFYQLLKLHFNNSCIYDYRYRLPELSERLKLSQKAVCKYIDKLKTQELTFEHSKNLCLKSIRCFGRRKTTININKEMTLTEVSYILYGKLIEKQARKQAFAENIRRLRRGEKHNSKLSETPFKPSISFNSIAKLCNCSHYKAIQIIKFLEKQGEITRYIQKPEKISEDFTALDSIQDIPGHHFNIGNKLYRTFGQKIEFSDFPLFLKNKLPVKFLKKEREYFSYMLLWSVFFFPAVSHI